ncbi:hypothetical protein ACFL43_02390 [Thermodesulfobacteriota bacterium]
MSGASSNRRNLSGVLAVKAANSSGLIMRTGAPYSQVVPEPHVKQGGVMLLQVMVPTTFPYTFSL